MLTNAGEDGERWPHLSMRSAQFLESDAQLRLLRLLRWRDVQARSSDKPRSWILDNELASQFARVPPLDRAQLQTQLEAHPKAPRKLTMKQRYEALPGAPTSHCWRSILQRGQAPAAGSVEKQRGQTKTTSNSSTGTSA